MPNCGVQLRLEAQHAAQKILASNSAAVNGWIDGIDDMAWPVGVDTIPVKIVAAFFSGKLLCLPYQAFICVHGLCQPPVVSLAAGWLVSAAVAMPDLRNPP